MYGNLLHGLLQAALQEQDFSTEATQARLEGMLKREDVRLDVWGAGLNVRDVAQDFGERAREGFKTFGSKWVGAQPGVSSYIATAVFVCCVEATADPSR